jgi:adenylate cyclase
VTVSTAGALATIESPVTVLRLARLTGGAGVISTCAFAGLFFVYAEPVAGWLTMGLALAYLAVWVAFLSGSLAGRLGSAVAVVVAVAAVNHLGVHLALGGFANSGGYVVWGVAVTLVAGLVLPRRAVLAIAVLYCVAVGVLGWYEADLSASRLPPTEPLPTILFVIVITGAFGMLVPLFGYFLERLSAERARAEGLMANILPTSVANRLKTQPGMIADRSDSCTILFADLVGFTAHSKGTDPTQVVGELNTIFSRFDALAEKHGAEKIKTIGDGYMAACGLPDADPDHVSHACDLALAMVDAMQGLNTALGTEFALRVGVHTGSAVSGVVGTSKFSFDVWGETVNLASRLESYGEPGVVTASAAVAESITGTYDVELRGIADLKGQGPTEVFRIRGQAQAPRAAKAS